MGKTREFGLHKLPIKHLGAHQLHCFFESLCECLRWAPALPTASQHQLWGALRPALSPVSHGPTHQWAGISSRAPRTLQKILRNLLYPPVSPLARLHLCLQIQIYTSFRLLSIPLYGYIIKVAFRWLPICYWTITMNT